MTRKEQKCSNFQPSGNPCITHVGRSKLAELKKKFKKLFLPTDNPPADWKSYKSFDQGNQGYLNTVANSPELSKDIIIINELLKSFNTNLKNTSLHKNLILNHMITTGQHI